MHFVMVIDFFAVKNATRFFLIRMQTIGMNANESRSPEETKHKWIICFCIPCICLYLIDESEWLRVLLNCSWSSMACKFHIIRFSFCVCKSFVIQSDSVMRFPRIFEWNPWQKYVSNFIVFEITQSFIHVRHNSCRIKIITGIIFVS